MHISQVVTNATNVTQAGMKVAFAVRLAALL